MLLLPLFDPPGVLTRTDYRNTMKLQGWDRLHWGTPPTQPDRGGTQKIAMEITLNPTEFLLMVLKIAYAAVCVDRDRSDFDENYAEDLLLGRRNDVANFVGSDPQGRQLYSEGTHNIRCFNVEVDGAVYSGANVQLFAKHASNPYTAIVARRESVPR
ncbi:hypothetical protein DB347_20750 [Opitutaceae bacterium EW11]|nr:hypothetical protein DB347_20750 [Opitutaceae bacterium EW11]